MLLGLCLTLVLLAAQDSSLLPLSWLLALLDKLAQLLKYNPDQQVVERLRKMITERRQFLQSLLPDRESMPPSLLFKLILALLKQLIRVIALCRYSF